MSTASLPSPAAAAGTTIGVLGGRWRAGVTDAGTVVPDDGSAPLAWWVAAEDRWHDPAAEPTRRQRLIDGAPVVETALRVPGGDAVQRIYAVPELGGLVVVEVENRSPASFAAAFSRRDLLTSRPPSAVAVEGIEAPPDSLVVPVGHGTTVRVALARDGLTGSLPAAVPSAAEVARGWALHTDAAGRIDLPDTGALDGVRAERARLLLEGPGGPDDGPSFVVAVAELGRLGEDVEDDLPDVAVAATALARRHRREPAVPWDVSAALAAAQDVLARAGDGRGATDTALVRARLGPPAAPPPSPPPGPLSLAWRREQLATEREGVLDLLPAPFPAPWLGHPLDAYGVAAAGWTVGLAVRWHGERPALLWALEPPLSPAGAGGPGTARRVTCSGLDPSWSSPAAQGEALLGVPAVRRS